jgi:DNA mismatch repair ATPase MutS
MFWDETTQEAIGWADVWGQFQPLSKPGQRVRRAARAYLPHERDEWAAAMQDWQLLRASAADPDWAQACREALAKLPDILPILNVISQGAGLRVVDVFELKTFLWHGRTLHALQAFAWWPALDWEQLLRLLNPGGDLVPAFSLADVQDKALTDMQDDLQRIDAEVYRVKKEQTERLRQDFGRAPTRDGLYIVEKNQADLTHADLRLQSVNLFEAVFEVIEPPQVLELRAEREQLLTRIEDREAEVLHGLAAALAPHLEALERGYDACGRLDWALAKANAASKWGAGTAHWLTDPAPWHVEQGWHPTARTSVESRGGTYTPLDLTLSPGVGLITGPNMGGKTLSLKTLGLLQALAQYALPIPAAEFRFHPVERIGWSGGDDQSLVSGLSSFGAEMQRLAALLRAPGRALLLLDEVARTTNPEEGEALAVGLADYLRSSAHTALFASHFPGVTQVAGLQGFRVAGLLPEVLAAWEQDRTSADPDRLLAGLQQAMDYRLLPAQGLDVPRDALRIARLFGLPEEITRKEGQ